MAKDKQRTVNPATAHLKAEKQRALKKSKAQQAIARDERLAQRNPVRLERRIAELHELRDAAAGLKPRERDELAKLERDLGMIRRARERRGDTDRAPRRDREREGEGGVLGKRRREDGVRTARWQDEGPESSETDEEARGIPMPMDSEFEPPIPRRRGPGRRRGGDSGAEAREDGGTRELPAKLAAPAVARTVYESKPVMRDLRKEATRFVPAAVQSKLAAAKGEGRLMEPEEAERLEREGYFGGRKDQAGPSVEGSTAAGGDRDLETEEERLERELRETEHEIQRGGLMESALKDATLAADAAEDEAVSEMIVDEAEGRLGDEGKTAERVLRRVEIEEVDDEDDGY